MYGVVYKITNKLNGKPYVGQTIRSINERFKEHAHSDSPLGNDIRNFGIENFTIEVIKECQTPEELNKQERLLIVELGSLEPRGYNRRNYRNKKSKESPWTSSIAGIFNRFEVRDNSKMSFRLLEYFIAVAKEKSITRAAAKIPITQPALSRAIQSLEEELGQKLFTREKYFVKLTTAGFKLLRRAEEILQLVHDTKIEFTSEEVYGDVYIGCAESDAIKYLARAIKNVRERYPNIRFNFHSGNFEDTYFRLDKGLLDFNVTLQSVDALKYDSLTLPAQDVWGVILRRDDPLADKKFFTVEDLRSLPLILSREALREEYPKFFGAAFEKFQVVATYNLLYNAAILAREGLGYVVSIDKLANDAELCFRPLEPGLESRLRFIWRKNFSLTPQAQILLDEMKSRLE